MVRPAVNYNFSCAFGAAQHECLPQQSFTQQPLPTSPCHHTRSTQTDDVTELTLTPATITQTAQTDATPNTDSIPVLTVSTQTSYIDNRRPAPRSASSITTP